MNPRHSAKFLTIGAAAAFALGVITPAVSQVPTDTATARNDTTPAVSQQRIPVTKEQGALDTTTSSGALSRPTDTTTRQGITGINDTTVNADTTMRDTLMTDTSTTMMTDTTIMRDTTTMPTDTTMMPTDTTMMPTDTTMMPTDTTMMPTDTTMMPTDTTTMPTDTTRMPTDTAITTDTSAGAVTSEPPTADTVGMYPGTPRAGRLGGGFYIGVGGGASVPMGGLHDGGYDTGWNVTVPIGWQSSTTPWGLRLDLSYDRLNGSTISAVPGASVTLSDANIWSGALDLTLQFPFGNSRSAFYLMGGGGLHRFTDYGSGGGAVVVDGNTLYGGSNGSVTKAGVNGGAGLSFGFGRTNLFLESRYVSVFTEGKNSNFVPIILGVRVY